MGRLQNLKIELLFKFDKIKASFIGKKGGNGIFTHLTLLLKKQKI